MRSIFPGGGWWRLSSYGEDTDNQLAEPVSVWIALRRMWGLIGEDKWIVNVAVGSLIIAAVSEICMPNLLAASIFSAQKGEIAVFHREASLLVLLCFSSGVCSGLRNCCFAVTNTILVKRLRETLYSVIVFQDISFFDSMATGILTSRLGADCQKLSYTIANDLQIILRNTFQGTGALIALMTLSWPLALSALATCSVLSAIFLVYGRYQKKAARLTQELNASANEVAKETLFLIRTVQVYGTEKAEVGRYEQLLSQIASISVRESVAIGFWVTSFNILYRVTQVTAVLFGGMAFTAGYLSPEQLTKYVLYCEWLIYATRRIVDHSTSLMQSIGASEKVFQLMNMLPSDQFVSKGAKLHSLLGNIHYADVSFRYPSRAPILDHMNLNIDAGEMIAIVGLSGSGKSTLVSLLLRLYEPTNGEIFVDGFPLKQLDIRWVREHIGFVGQEPRLFRMDIRSNITYGCIRDVKDEEVIWAAKHAHAHEFISSLPHGYETVVDDNLLSGGQKQRVAIARAILRHPTILILDEPTSALDSESEHHITAFIRSFRNSKNAKRTVIVTAHRLSTARAADRIVVMKDGQIIEMGGHDELYQRGGFYAHLVRMQMESLA